MKPHHFRDMGKIVWQPRETLLRLPDLEPARVLAATRTGCFHG